MAISKETIDKIYAVFRHLQLVDTFATQAYREDEEYRRGIVIAKGRKSDMSADEVYCHALKLTPWRIRIWKKRQKEIPHTAFCEWIDDVKVWRLGFRTY